MPRDIDGVIHTDEVDCVFSDRVVDGIAKRARLPAETDINRLAMGVRASAKEYAKQVRQATPNTVRRQIAGLARAAASRDYLHLIEIYRTLPDAARNLLEKRSQRNREQGVDWILPDPADLYDPERQQSAAATIYKLAATGGYREKGRKRPNGKRSKDRWLPSLYAPPPSRSEPRRAAERDFLMWLRDKYCDATGGRSGNTARRDILGPFARFFAECLELARTRTTVNDPDRAGLAVQLINDFAAEIRKSKLIDELRQLLKPWWQQYLAVSELARMIENGQAAVRHVAVGMDAAPAPDAPALIEFEETGNLCFYVSPRLAETIHVEPASRARIMVLAMGLQRSKKDKRAPA